MNNLPNYLKNESIKKIANKKEKKIYKHLVSGALDWKGDLSTDNCCIEIKTTTKKSIKITERILDKLLMDSISMGKSNSILVIELPSYYITCRVKVK